MALKSMLIVVGSMVGIVILSAFYIFPDVICNVWNTKVPSGAENEDSRDPISEFCGAVN